MPLDGLLEHGESGDLAGKVMIVPAKVVDGPGTRERQ